ncbi:MAG: NAD-dependent deacetylase [Betaproteobacteria bacterium]|nr:NAD-dependent deacetylase [Betaproteobacteria bacterium]
MRILPDIIPSERALERACTLMAGADALLVTAGAGMGIDSGLPDFRGPGGFWRAYPALGRRGIDFTEIASPAAFDALPRLAWGFYGHRLALYRVTRPHRGFAILRRLGKRTKNGLRVFTSNVDGQFQKAGVSEDHVAECHGSIHWLQCLENCGRRPWTADDIAPDVDEETCEWRGALPTCPDCDGLARPNILMFGDYGWTGSRYSRQEEQLERWLGRARALVVIEVDAGTAIPSARRFGEWTRAPIIRINPREPEIRGERDVSLPLGALDALQFLEARLDNARA